MNDYEQLNTEEKVYYLMDTLNIVLEEIHYKDEFKNIIKNAGLSRSSKYIREPNVTIAREGLRSVGRLAYILAREVGKEFES